MKQKTEAELILENDLMRNLITSLPDYIWAKDLQGKYIATNRNTAAFFGSQETDLLGKTDFDFFDRDIADEFTQQDLEILNTGKPRMEEQELIHPQTRNAMRVETTKAPLFNSNGELVGVMGIAHDITRRKIAEQKLRETERKYRTLVDSANDALIVVGINGEILEINRVTSELLGYPREELLQLRIQDIVPPALAKDVPHRIADIIERGSYIFESRHRRKDSSEFPAEISARAITWDDGSTVMLGYVRNITKRKQTEQALRESERSLQLALNAGRIGVWDWNIPNDAITWDDRSCAFFGVRPGSVISFENIPRLFHPSDWPRVQTAVQDSLENNTRFDMIYRIVWPDETIRRIHALGEVIRDETGTPVRFSGIHIDCTEELLAQEILHENDYLLNSAQAMAHMGSWKLDYTNNTATGTDELYRILGLNKEVTQASLQTYMERTHPDDRNRVMETYTGSLKKGEKEYEINYRVIHADTGEVRHVHSKTSHIRNEEGKPLYSVGLIQDITEQVLAQQEHARMEAHLQDIQKLESLGVLAGGIAHDFNNILMSMMGYAQISKAKLPDSSPLQSNLDQIVKSGQYASELCNQMLAYAGSSSLAEEVVSLQTIVENTLQILQASIANDCTLNLLPQETLPCVIGDPTQVSQILMNLVINSSEAIGENRGIITLSTGVRDNLENDPPEDYILAPEVPGAYVYLKVSDTGCGMDKGNIVRIFEPFYTSKFMGRGLGLSAVLGIVRSHKGALQVVSESGKGTTINVFFPAVYALEEGSLSEPDRPADWQGEGCVLLVDDEESVRVITGYILKDLGLKVLLASDGENALEVYHQHRNEIDVILLDLTMPRMDGHKTFEELKKINPAVPVVLASGFSETAITDRFSGEGLADSIKKPYSAGKLCTTLSKLLPKASTQTKEAKIEFH